MTLIIIADIATLPKKRYTIFSLDFLHTHYRRDCENDRGNKLWRVWLIHRGKILALYKSYKNRYEGWVLPKGTVEKGETHIQTALREVREEADVRPLL